RFAVSPTSAALASSTALAFCFSSSGAEVSVTLVMVKDSTTPSVRGSKLAVAKLLRVALSRRRAARKKSLSSFCSADEPEQAATHARVAATSANNVLARRCIPASSAEGPERPLLFDGWFLRRLLDRALVLQPR